MAYSNYTTIGHAPSHNFKGNADIQRADEAGTTGCSRDKVTAGNQDDGFYQKERLYILINGLKLMKTV